MICEKCQEEQGQRIEFVVSAEEEHETPEQSERNTRSAPGYAKAVRKVMAEAEGRWGWCSVAVTAKLMIGNRVIDEETAYLGNCSYRSAQDFILNSGYFPGMCKEAVQKLNSCQTIKGEW